MAKNTDTLKPAPATTAAGFAVGRAPSAAARGGKLPNFKQNSRYFYLACHQSSWELVNTADGWRLLPVLKRLVVQPGVLCAQPKGRDPVSHATLITRNMEMGFTVFNRKEDIDTYLAEYDGAHGSKGYFTNWERIKTYPDGEFEVVMDPAAEHTFRLDLVSSGRVEQPRDAIVSTLRNNLKKRVNRATKTPHLAGAQSTITESEARLKGLDEALAFFRAPKAEREAS